jgi:hypothetical protein
MSWVVLAYLCSMVNTSDCTYVTYGPYRSVDECYAHANAMPAALNAVEVRLRRCVPLRPMPSFKG